ncbi:hypothetical protein F5Y15DRAFT_403399 [Xylariaceae sp. FL0016]|nr:hypothetical protein F5Y15DRAFT_403399 [Xylariaceae sp. FL0016]
MAILLWLPFGSLVASSFICLRSLMISTLWAMRQKPKALGTNMGMYVGFGYEMRDSNFLGDDPRKKNKQFNEDYFEDAIVINAEKRGVTLKGPEDIYKVQCHCRGDIELPKQGTADPFGFKSHLGKYKTRWSSLAMALPLAKHGYQGIGGDALDITTWTSAQRKAKAFGKKDPMKKKTIDALKEGLVMQMG